MILEKEKPLLVINANVFFQLMIFMFIVVGFSGFLLVRFWPAQKTAQLFALFIFLAIDLTAFILIFKLESSIANADPEMVFWNDHVKLKGGNKIQYQEISRITKKVTKTGKHYDVEIIFECVLGKLVFNEFDLETGYDEIKYVLHKIPSAKHIEFIETDNFGEHWWV